MRHPPRTTIVNVGYRSTNYWVISAGRSRLLVDLGWPGTIDSLRAQLARRDIPLAEVRLGLATHFHIDHAGLAQDLKDAGMSLLVVDLQLPAIPVMKQHTKPADRYREIALHDNLVVSLQQSREVLADAGLAGQLLHTPGHSDDSVSLLLDDGTVFTGDLTHPMLVTEAESAAVNASWDLLRNHGATMIHPGHGPIRPMHDPGSALPAE